MIRKDGDKDEFPGAGGQATLVTEADLHRRVSDFLAANPIPGRRQMAGFLLTELLAERRGWQRLLAGALAEVERERRNGNERQRQEYGECEASVVARCDREGSDTDRGNSDEEVQGLREQLAVALAEVGEARGLSRQQAELLEDLARLLARMEARLELLQRQRRRCLRLLLGAAPHAGACAAASGIDSDDGCEEDNVSVADVKEDDDALLQLVGQLIATAAAKATTPPSPPPPPPPPPLLPARSSTFGAQLPQPPPSQVPQPPQRQLRFPYPVEVAPSRRRAGRPLAAAASEAAAAAVFPAGNAAPRRCLRCRQAFRPVENGPTTCKFHSQGQVRNCGAPGAAFALQFSWACCGRLPYESGCCHGRHV